MSINKFTETFIDLCNKTKLTQEELSNNIKINQSQISRYLAGVLPNIKTIVKICDYFDCSIDYMVGLTEKQKYVNLKKGFTNTIFYLEYKNLLAINKTNHFQLSNKNLVCGTSLTLWKRGMLPSFEAIYNIAYELGGSIDKMLGRI